MSQILPRWSAESADRLLASDDILARSTEEGEDEEDEEEDEKEQEDGSEDEGDGYSK